MRYALAAGLIVCLALGIWLLQFLALPATGAITPAEDAPRTGAPSRESNEQPVLAKPGATRQAITPVIGQTDADAKTDPRYQLDPCRVEIHLIPPEPTDGAPGLDLSMVFVEIDIAGARWQQQGRRRSVRANAAGHAVFDGLPPGSFSVRSTAGGRASFRLDPGASHVQQLELPNQRQITGVVLDGLGAPLPEASVWSSFGDDGRHGVEIARTNEDGAFHTTLPRGMRWLGARKPGHIRSLLVRSWRGPHAATVELRMRGKDAPLELEVVDSDRRPIANAAVFVGVDRVGTRESTTGGNAHGLPAARRFVTNHQGIANITGMMIGEHPFTIVASGHAIHRTTIRIDYAKTRHRCLLPPERVLTGRVTPDAGLTVPTTIRTEALSSFGALQARTDDHGFYRLYGVPSGTLSVVAYGKDGNTAKVTLRVETSDRVVHWNPRAKAAPSVRARLQDRAGNPLVRWGVMILETFEDGGMRPYSMRTDGKGEFELGNPGAETRIAVYAPTKEGLERLPSQVFKAREPSGKGEDRRDSVRAFVCDRGRSPSGGISGTIRPARAGIVGHIRLSVDWPLAVTPIHSDASGEVVVTSLPPGTYRIDIERDGKTYSRSDLRVTAGGTSSFGTIDLNDL